ncbi:MAG: hypothetical protein GTO51_00560 [Candidatus Latescibacteria bacterium]|nr:hypothetical protein [Candidatus Latescibacterota bacterium]NIM64474.1 hypothetical protein [Candidatus Latescibacterota bacterium]NIO00627.1 hypothetical protein [Candidatus Latescibacterota bacterium]NIO27028.1 hypothetical protein [Candidatus Latescibacterota bacterium]NIO54553.1 hypothetical protein [Candidatus Latescibacterota bacterium]
MSQQIGGQNLPRVEFQVHFRTGQRGRKHLRKGASSKEPVCPNEDLPRLTRLLALAHRWNRLIDEGVVGSYSEIASLMGISRARVSQITDLLYLAPEIQEHILVLSNRRAQVDVPERAVRSLTKLPIWKEQYKLWKETIRDD